MSRNGAKTEKGGSKRPVTKAKARDDRTCVTRADLEQQLSANQRENARMRDRLFRATIQQAAISEMLRLISHSPIQLVLDAVAEQAARLCEANNARIWRLEDDRVWLVATYGESSTTMDGREGLPVNRQTVTGRAACDRCTIHVHDISAEVDEFSLGSSNVQGQGWHTTLATPLLREGIPIGIILIRRTAIRPFEDEQIALLETFAGQAAIAIENVRLFEAVQESERQSSAKPSGDDSRSSLASQTGRPHRLCQQAFARISWIPPRGDHRLGMDGQGSPGRRGIQGAGLVEQPRSCDFPRRRLPISRRGTARIDGSMCAASFLHDTEGRVQNWYGVLIDVDDQKTAEEASRDNELRLREIIDTVPSMVWSASPDGQPTYLNQRVLDYSGLHLENFLNLGWEAFIHPEDFLETATAFFHAIQTGQSYEIAHRLRRADGQYRWHHARGEPLRDKQQRIIQWYGLATDIEEAKRAENELRSTQALLTRASQAATVAELSASIAHEINQPLAGIVASAQTCRTWLSGDNPNLPRAQAAIERIIRDGNAAADIIRRIRALFRQSAPTKAPVNINAMIEEVGRLAQHELDRRVFRWSWSWRKPCLWFRLTEFKFSR